MPRPILEDARIHPAIRDRIAHHHADIVREVQAAVAAHPVVVVGMAQNPYPRRARKALRDAGVEHEYLEYGSYLSEWRRRNALKMWSGWPTLPMVFVKGTLVGGADDLVRLCAKYMGHSVNNIPEDMLPKIERMLIKQKPFVKAFHDDNGQDLLASGEVDLVLEYNGDIAQVMKDDPDLDFVVPKEGSLINSDTLCIPKGAPRPNNAHAFIDFYLRPENAALMSNEMGYPTGNKAGVAQVKPEIAGNKTIFVEADYFSKMIPPSSFTNEAREAMSNAYNSFKKGK